MSSLIICGTGHRPNKLGGYGEDAQWAVYDTALAGIQRLAPDKIITGMALGWDQAIAWVALELGIPYIAAIPFEGQEKAWPAESQADYQLLLHEAEKVECICEPGYAPWKMQKRNEWMVFHSDLVLALWDGSDGGTANCIRYANKVGKPITNLWEQYNAYKEDSQESS